MEPERLALSCLDSFAQRDVCKLHSCCYVLWFGPSHWRLVHSAVHGHCGPSPSGAGANHVGMNALRHVFVEYVVHSVYSRADLLSQRVCWYSVLGELLKNIKTLFKIRKHLKYRKL